MPVIPNNPFFVSCDEMFQDRQGTARSLDGSAEHRRQFKVVVKDSRLSDVAVSLCPGIPLLASFYETPAWVGADGTPFGAVEYDLLALCHKISAKQQDADDWQIWIVTCDYSRNLQSSVARADNPQAAEKQKDDPTLEVPDVSWDFEETTEIKQRDLFGSTYVNTAQQLFNPSLKRPVCYPVLNISRNERNFNYQTAQSYAYALNDKTFLTAPRGVVQCLPPKAVQKNRGFFFYWRTSYKLRFRPLQQGGGYVLPPLNVLVPNVGMNGKVTYVPAVNFANFVDSWQPLVLNQGMYRLGRGAPLDMPGIKGLPVPIFKHGQHVHHNVLLDEKGQEAKSPDPKANPPADIPAWWKQFIDFRYASFSSLLVKGLS